MTQYYGGQNLTPETPVYLAIYHLMGYSYNGFPVFQLVKVYACEFQDYDNLWANHAGVPQNNQAIVFYREPANPFQGQAVDMSNPFDSPLAMEREDVKLLVRKEMEAIRDSSGNIVGYQADVKLTPAPEANVIGPINWGPDPFLPSPDIEEETPKPGDSVWDM